MEENFLTWNLPNWITVVLMVVLSFAILGAVANFYKRKQTAA